MNSLFLFNGSRVSVTSSSTAHLFFVNIMLQKVPNTFSNFTVMSTDRSDDKRIQCGYLDTQFCRRAKFTSCIRVSLIFSY